MDEGNQSSDEIRVEYARKVDYYSEPEWEKLTTSVNPILFKKFSGSPISFHCKIDNLGLKSRYEHLIVSYGGLKMEDYIDMDDTTALMVLDKSKVMLYERPTFKVSYIIDCIEKNTLLDITKYLHNHYSFKSGNYMNILFWETDKFLCKNLQPYQDSSGSSEEDIKISKHSRDLYSKAEKEAILKFLLSRKQLSGIRGNSVWKRMEKRGVCPKRTYQSMKNHFLKTLLFELDRYEFLSEADKKMLLKT